jgi:signal transduction histidine kinase
MLEDRSGDQKRMADIGEETIKDIRFSLNTIQKRSERLLDFVESYRRLTRVPRPVIQSVSATRLLTNIETLMREELARNVIQLSMSLENQDLQLRIDPSLVEQVLINLMKNSIHALEDRPEKKITIKVYPEDQNQVIEIEDTGKGIPEKELSEIFIPFFSTKKDGSGIGLSLSKQIMSLHGGRIRVKSVENKGTSFFLIFRNSAS